MFGISIFKQPQHFIALYIGLFEQGVKGLSQLNFLLSRTKNPPISAVYTYELLKQKSYEEYGLDIIRFLSQLSDLSEGFSMSSSLQNAIGESSFLTQMRHNLTHKIKISDYLIQMSRKIILLQLKQKFWLSLFRKFMMSYIISTQRLCLHYKRIYEDDIPQERLHQILSNKRQISGQWLKNESSNYEFKEFFFNFFETSKESQVVQLLKEISKHKKAIAISQLILRFCYDNRNEKFCNMLVKIIVSIPNESFFMQNLVQSSLKKLTFIHYLGFSSKVIRALPKKVVQQISDYWKSKQQILKKKGRGCLKKKFSKEEYLNDN